MNDGVHVAFETLRLPCPHCAVGLLAVLLLGLLITTFTRGWIGALPAHDHLLLGLAHANGGTTRHIHPGDGLDRAQAALRIVVPARPYEQVTGHVAPFGASDGQRIVSSLAASGAQPDNSTFTFNCVFDWAGTPPPTPTAGTRLPDEHGPTQGRSLTPSPPPPRIA